MLCVNPENGVLVIKDFAIDGTCQFITVMTDAEAAQLVDHITAAESSLIIASVCGAYASVFVIKLVLQQLGYRF